MKHPEPTVNRAIHCQNLVFRSRRPDPEGGIDGLGIHQRMVLLVLNDMIGSGKTSWTVCQKEIAERAGCGRTAASKAITSLVRAGILKAEYGGPASSVLTYEIDAAKLVGLQRPPRSRGQGVRGANSDAGSHREQPAVREPGSAGPPREPDCARGEQIGPQGERGTVPEPGPAAAPRPSEGTLPAGAGRGPSDAQVLTRSPPARKSTVPLSHLEFLSPYNRSVVLDVEREVRLKELRSDPERVGLELNEVLNCYPGVRAADLVQVLTSGRFAGLRELSWGLVLLTPELFDRFAHLLGEAVSARLAAAAAGDTPLEAIELGLRSAETPERLAGVDCLASRFERTGKPAWLLRLAAVFAGKGRDPLPQVRLRAIEHLQRILILTPPALPAKVLVGLGVAIRRASQDELLRPAAEFIMEEYLATHRESASCSK